MHPSEHIQPAPLLIDDRVMMICYFLWSFALVGVSALSILLLISSPDVAMSSGYDPAGWKPPPVAWVVVGWFCIISLANICAAALIWLRKRWTWRFSFLAVIGGLSVCLAPAMTRAMLPWEDPNTGEGSPLAVLMTLVFLAVFFNVVIGTPGIAGLIWLVKRKLRLMPF